MIDIHTHILPGLDDGARDMDDSVAMAELAAESGVHTIVATPHRNLGHYFGEYSLEQYQHRLNDLRRILKEEGIPVVILSGMEIFTTEDVPEMIGDGWLIPLNHSRYYLMEFDFGIDGTDMEWLLSGVMESGYIPVIAHPERYACIQESPETIRTWMNQGCLAQINKGSVFGRFGRRAKECADILLESRMVTCIASDAHKPYERTTFMADIKDYMEERYSFEYSKKLLYDNPLKMIQNQRIDS